MDEMTPETWDPMAGTDLKSKFIGAMVGSALGDAIGELAFEAPERGLLVRRVEQHETLVYTDDTAMAIGLAESILAKSRIDPQHLGETFSRNFFREPWRGYASGPPRIFATVQSSRGSYVEVAKGLFGGVGSFGNGAAMRVAPVGLFFGRSKGLYEAASASAEVTHAHPIGKDGAAVQAWAVAQAIQLDPQERFPAERVMQGIIAFARTEQLRQKMKQVEALVREEASSHEAADRLGRSVEVDQSLPFALYSFLRYPGSFEDCLFCAVLNGGDRDTLGAMACAISGAYLGVEAIPENWRERLENRELIENLAVSLFELEGK